MNRQMMITAAAALVALVITLGLLQYVIHLQGAPLKLLIGIVVAVIAGAVAFFVTRAPATQA